MFLIYLLSKPETWIIPWIIQAIIYYRLLKKIGLNQKKAFIPFLAEGEFSKIYFKNRRFYFHALILFAIFCGSGMYLRWASHEVLSRLVGVLFILAALLIYGCFLLVLYWKIAKSFGKGFFYRIFTVLIPYVFLFLLTLKKAKFQGSPVYTIHRFIKRPMRIIYNIGREIVFLGEAAGIAAGVLFLTIQMYMPRPMVEMVKYDTISKVSNIHGDGKITDREASMGSDFSKLNSTYAPSREKYFPSHAQDKSVVVLEYIIGSNLEDKMGLASVNIDQMFKATENGSSLKFVMEAGGSQRWFTSGIADYSRARYEIADGKLTKIEDLDKSISMSDPDQLAAFLTWAKQAYPADRYMLVLWDHGGGLSSGFGQDAVNKRDANDYGTIFVDEMVSALQKSGMKFDLIGFDACLMQGVELAKALEPYADYYLASEETEDGYGWFYTSAFNLLAKDPSVATEVFAKEAISSFDVYNAVLNHGDKKPNTTLSLIDLSRINPAYDKLLELYEKQNTAFLNDPADYADIAYAAYNSYAFKGDEQLDLIDYLNKLDGADYDDSIISSEEIKEIINYFKAAIVYHNAASYDSINGIAVTFPYEQIGQYSYEHNQYKALDMKEAQKFYDEFFSIMAVKKKEQQDAEKGDNPLADLIPPTDYTQEEWYIQGFENYADIPTIVDIPLIQVENGYKLDLPDTVWKIVVDAKEYYFQKADEGWRYLGNDTPGSFDENGHPVVSTDGYWIHINDHLVAYEPVTDVETDKAVIFKGAVKALLNDKTKILLQIEWDPISEESGDEVTGRVVGYVLADNDQAHMEKGIEQLSPGQNLQFLFDYYDDEGKLIKSDEPYGGRIIITSQDALRVEDKHLGECDLKYGIGLTDAYQRTFETELIDSHIDKE